MDSVPHWLEKTVFAAGMTAYAVEVDAKIVAETKAPPHGAASEDDSQDSFH